MAKPKFRQDSTKPQGEIDRLLGYMPIIVRAAGVSEWERKFCASIIARSRKGAFRPSARQADVMARLVDDFQERTMRDEADDDGALITDAQAARGR